MICFPNAKVNMGLSVLDKRPDGFHNLSTCIIPIPIYDILEVTLSETFRFVNYGLKVPGINIINKTWKYLTGVFDKIAPVSICLYKNIPMGAGLGGGSSDATFFLKMINDICKLSLSHIELMEIANLIGSDCPFFIENRSAFATGKGEILRPFNVDLSGKWIILVNPNLHVSTADAFSGVTVDDSKTDLTDNLTSPLSSWKESIINKFETSVFRKYPQIESLKKEFYNSGAVYASMTGSGSTIYGIFDQEPTVSFNQFFTWKGRL